jgi:ABC-2 type transport system ATP-binding protein
VSNVIEVNNLIKKYNKADRNAVNSISFSVKEGEFFTLLGPNGAGKTTTISILTTTLSKTAGQVEIAGLDVEKNANDVRQQVGIIFQQPSLDQNLTAEENVRFHTILYGMYPFRPTFTSMPQEYQARVMELADIVGIKKEIFKPIKTFSGGMKRKLEIVRGLMHKPRVLFLDEPTTGLDPASRHNVWEYLQKIRKSQQITIFLTTHYLEEAEGADRVCIINDGEIIALGTPREIKKELVQHYLLLDAEDPTALKEELKKHQIEFSEEEHLKVPIQNLSIQDIIKKVETPLTLVETHTPTLEEAYLSIIEEDTHEQGN